MKLPALAFGIALTVAAVAAAEEPRRELGAHVHGQGSLDVAIEGNRVVMEFHAPGADITGTEAKAETAEAKAVQAAAIASLEKPLALFVLPAAAGCTVVSAKVQSTADDDDDDQPPADGKAASPAPQAAKPAEPAHGHDHEHEHAEFQASFELTCTKPALVTSLQLDYFRIFPRAQKVIVQVVTAKGSNKFEATAASPRIELGGLM